MAKNLLLPMRNIGFSVVSALLNNNFLLAFGSDLLKKSADTG